VELLRTVPLRYVAVVLSTVFFDPTVGGIAAVILLQRTADVPARRGEVINTKLMSSSAKSFAVASDNGQVLRKTHCDAFAATFFV